MSFDRVSAAEGGSSFIYLFDDGRRYYLVLLLFLWFACHLA